MTRTCHLMFLARPLNPLFGRCAYNNTEEEIFAEGAL